MLTDDEENVEWGVDEEQRDSAGRKKAGQKTQADGQAQEAMAKNPKAAEEMITNPAARPEMEAGSRRETASAQESPTKQGTTIAGIAHDTELVVADYLQVLIREHDDQRAEQDDAVPKDANEEEFAADSDNSLLREIAREHRRRKAFKEAKITPKQQKAREQLEKALGESGRFMGWESPRSTLSEAVEKRRANFLSESEGEEEPSPGGPDEVSVNVTTMQPEGEDRDRRSELTARKRRERIRREGPSTKARKHKGQPRSSRGRFSSK